MLRWTIRLGYCLLAVGLLLMSPLPDLLPVDLWIRMAGLFSSRPHAPFFRVVPADDRWLLAGPGLAAAGLFLVTLGILMRRRR